MIIFGNNGYILLEILVSLAIIAIVFISLFRMQSGTIDLASTGKFKNMAPILAQLMLSEIEADLANAEDASGGFDDTIDGYTWKYTISKGDIGDLDIIHESRIESLVKIDLVITGVQDHKDFRLTTWRTLE